jgi:hypothetical protein
MDPGLEKIRIRDEHPRLFIQKLKTFFGLRTLKSGSEIFLTLDPGWKNSNPGSGVNIPDPQH